MTKKTNDNNKISLLFTKRTRGGKDFRDILLADDSEKHAVRGVESLTYGFGEDKETADLMRDFAAIANPVDGTWTVVPRPRNPGIEPTEDSENDLEYIDEIEDSFGASIRLLGPKI